MTNNADTNESYRDFHQYILEACFSDISIDSKSHPDDTTEPFTKQTFDNFVILYSHTIKKLRAEKDITQIQLALDLGVHVNTIKNWEKGLTEISNENLIKICAYFKKTPNFFLMPIDIDKANSVFPKNQRDIFIESKGKQEYENVKLDYVFNVLLPFNLNKISEKDFKMKQLQHNMLIRNKDIN